MWPFSKNEFTLEYTHVSGCDLIKFTAKSNNINDLFNSHVDFVDRFLKETEKHKMEYSKREKENMK